MASLYCCSIASTSTCVPYAGRSELMPNSGAGGCVKTASNGRDLFWEGDSRLRNEVEEGWARA